MTPPSIVVAELPGEAGRGQDRCRTADGLVIVLDGASAFDKQADPDASEYVDHLADALLVRYVDQPGCDLRDGLASAIETTAKNLDITPGQGPSSTVAVVRWGNHIVDTLALGDSTIVVSTTTQCDRITDDALTAIAPDVRRRYRDRLAAGGGFTREHKIELAELQRHQAAQRNRQGGYWIAEADPDAAWHAICRSYCTEEVEWFVIATDGAQKPIEHLYSGWHAVARFDAARASELLTSLHKWEQYCDPDGINLPRSKRHDDKTIAIGRSDWKSIDSRQSESE